MGIERVKKIDDLKLLWRDKNIVLMTNTSSTCGGILINEAIILRLITWNRWDKAIFQYVMNLKFIYKTAQLFP